MRIPFPIVPAHVRRFAVLVAALCGTPCLALDIAEPAPEYLQAKIRPQWRLLPMAEALKELGDEIEKPVAISRGLAESDSVVVLLENDRSTVREILELLERTQDLHFSAEPLRIRVETGSEHRRSQRRLVNLNLRDYGLFFIPRTNVPRPRNGFGLGDGENSHFRDWWEEKEPRIDPNQLIDVLSTEGDPLDAEIRGTGNLMVLATTDEEARLRANLDELYGVLRRTSTWRVHFGWLPEGQITAGGLLPDATLQALVKQLEQTQTLSLAALDTQNVTASREVARSFVRDVDIDLTGLDPVMNPAVDTASDGLVAQLRPLIGLESTLLVFHAEWTELSPPAKRETVRVPATTSPASASTTSKAEDRQGGATVTQTTSSRPTHLDPGVTLEIQPEARWEWRPSGEVFVPRGYGLVLVGPGGKRSRVIVFEEVR
ncbi:MAG: hypothetical protein AB7O52_16875 [Planctomycetota bacterium]